ncbi:MAG: MFS transporter [Pseudomonadales bacterium]|nr:MFS transporter [Pseudomonadales bacterium]HJN52745.1 MFS transporter [Pseudomonadales bacterium]
MQDFPLSHARRTLLASLVIVGMGFSVLFPILAPLGREMGLNELQITSIIAASAMTVFLCAPTWGRISDTWGRKRVMVIGLFGFTAGTVLFNSVLTAGLSGMLVGMPLFLTLLVARILHAAAMAAAMPSSTAYMADITDVATRTKGMGAAGAANNIGAILGPAMAGLAVISLLTPLWIMSGLALLNVLFVARFLPEAPRQVLAGRRPSRMKYTDGRILPFIIVGVLMFMGFALVQQTMGFRFQDALGLSAAETARTLGIAMMLSAGCSLFAQGFIVQRMDLAPFTLLKLAMPLLTIAFALMAIFDSQLMLTIAMMILGFGMGLAGPGFMAGASLAVSAEEQGAVAGVAGSCGPLGFTIGPLLGGALYQIEPVLPYAVAVAVYTSLMLFMLYLGPRFKVHS